MAYLYYILINYVYSDNIFISTYYVFFLLRAFKTICSVICYFNLQSCSTSTHICIGRAVLAVQIFILAELIDSNNIDIC